jgi:hypothetical protein
MFAWLAWREFTQTDKTSLSEAEGLAIKHAIAAEYGQEAMRRSWLKTCERLKGVTNRIASQRSSAVPAFDAPRILKDGFSTEEVSLVKESGCCIIRGAIQEVEAKSFYKDVKTYIDNNQSKIKGWPAASPSMLLLYDSPTQIALRTHPNQLSLQKCLNQIWHGYMEDTSPQPLLYSDGLRNRPPGQAFLGLGPHIDAGSLARWADPAYRAVYHQIFSGNPELHDCYNIELRKQANQAYYAGQAHSAVLRSFQGWTALSRNAPGEGGLLLYPNVEVVIAYLLLRPFFTPPADEAKIMDACEWTFSIDNAWFPGTFKEQSQLLSPSSHPHLRLQECLVNLPPMKAGDTVWWHADVSVQVSVRL